ncbi:MAG: tetratricopeptide repeat protein [Nitrospiraceae bacterium]|nr:tetratricopeptide repeat protein [Nitrospiraceae bacterium]
MNTRLALVLALALSVAGCEFFDRQATQEYEAATKRWNAGEYQAAVSQYILLVKEHPFSPLADNALYWVGVTQFLYLGETEKALETLRLLLKKYPRRDMAPAAQLQIAEIYELGYNDYPRAIEEYRKASQYPDKDVREKSLYSLADNLIRVGKIEEAKEAWLTQVSEFPRGSRADIGFYRLGTTAYSQGQIDNAELYYRKSLAVSKDKEIGIKAKFALAQCLEAEESLQEALKIYRELEPEYPNPAAIQIKIKALEARIIKKSY